MSKFLIRIYYTNKLRKILVFGINQCYSDTRVTLVMHIKLDM